MTKEGKRPPASAEERLMGILALNARFPKDAEPPAVDLNSLDESSLSDRDKAALFAYLDSDPEAFAAFIRRYRAPGSKPAVESNPALGARLSVLMSRFIPPAIPLAVATGLVLVVTLGWLTLPFFGDPSSREILNRGFVQLRDIEISNGSVPTMPWEQSRAGLGFSATSTNHDEFSTAFTVGLIEGVRNTGNRTAMENIDIAGLRGRGTNTELGSAAEQLGQWNIMLSVASASHNRLSPAFWSAQNHYLILLRGEFAQLKPPAFLDQHFTELETLLTDLSENRMPARNAADLNSALSVLRERFGLQYIDGVSQ